MAEVGVVGRIMSVMTNEIRVALDVASTGFTKVGPNGIQTVGVVNSYITAPAGAHRVVAIVTGVLVTQTRGVRPPEQIRTVDDESEYELQATIVGRFEGQRFRSGLTGYPPLHAPVRNASPDEVKSIFLPHDVPSIRIGTSAVAAEQDVHLDANLLLGHHCAVVGSTGSGKSCTVSAIIDGLLDHSISAGHIVIFDINGEYAKSFASGTERGSSTKSVVLGPQPGTDKGLYLPHWFMNNEENLALYRASEGVQAPVLQRAIADARITAGATEGLDLPRLLNVESTISIVEQLFGEPKNAVGPAFAQLSSLNQMVKAQAKSASPLHAHWLAMEVLLEEAAQNTGLYETTKWEPLTPRHRDKLQSLFGSIRKILAAAWADLGLGSGVAAPDFDAPIFFSLQALCDYFLPNRVKLEQANDNKIGSYVATLQMRLSRLLADRRYDFMTRVEQHEDPLGTYLKVLLGVDPGEIKGNWPAAGHYKTQAAVAGKGPSVTIFDLSLVASDVLENVTALLGRIVFDFAVRSSPRAQHPVLLVLEEAHRFIPSRKDPVGAGSRSTAVFERIAKEGRKFGLSLLLASQRPSELSETIVAQCGTVIAHRLTHEADQNLLRHATAMSSRALLDQLPGLAQQHALITGVSTGVPVAVRIRDVEDPPMSQDPEFMSAWEDESRLAELASHIDSIAGPWQHRRS
jgi:uncharacterized protein